MNRALEAYKFYLTKFPAATEDDIGSILDLLKSFGSMIGGGSMMYVDRALKNRGMDWKDEGAKEVIEEAHEDFEDMYWPNNARAGFLQTHFGIDPQEDFDPVELRDGFLWDPEIKVMYEKHVKSQAKKKSRSGSQKGKGTRLKNGRATAQ